jgi:pimeloyl-ACP methyl ester carboxylesterase
MRGLVAGVAAVVLLAACGGNASPKSGSESSGFHPAPTGPTSSDPARVPSVDGEFAVASGRKLALVCWGAGSPTVLLETGGANLEEWPRSGVVHDVAARTRVCTYDRAGTGRSDPAPNERRDADDVVADATAVLAGAGIDGPLVLVGRSFGGMVVTYFAQARPDLVVGVVVLDTPAPSAAFTEQSEPELVWNYPGNTEHLDVVHGFENRFAAHPPRFAAPLLVITPVPGEGSAQNESFWLRTSENASQVSLSCGQEPTEGACAAAVSGFVQLLTRRT